MTSTTWIEGKLHCLGCGPGSPAYVTPRVSGLVAQAEVLIGCKRCQELFPEAPGRRLVHSGNLSELLKSAEEALDQGLRVAWLCTGDTGLRSVATTVRKALGDTRVHGEPGISSVQIACARLSLDWSEIRIISAHGRIPSLRLENDQDYIVLAGSPEAASVLEEMALALAPSHNLHLALDLGLEEECITELSSTQLVPYLKHPRALLCWKRKIPSSPQEFHE